MPLDTLDAVTGERPRPMVPARLSPGFEAAGRFVEPAVTRPGIDRADVTDPFMAAQDGMGAIGPDRRRVPETLGQVPAASANTCPFGASRRPSWSPRRPPAAMRRSAPAT